MRIPLFLAVAQWALLLALGLLVIIAYRQLGRVLSRSKQPAELGPAVGSRAGRLAYQRLRPGGDQDQDTADAAPRSFDPGDGRPALVAFVDPTCPSCEELVTSLGAARASGQLGDSRILLLTSDPPGYLQISAAFRGTSLEIGRPLDHADVEAYRASATPLLVAIDGGGVVRSAGTAYRPAEVAAFGQACQLPPTGPLLPVTT
jgi:hypothetical protein